MLRGGSTTTPPPAALLTYTAKLKASAERLETIETTAPPEFSAAARDEVRNAVNDLREHLVRYKNLVAAMESSWEICGPAALQDALDKSDSVTRSILEQSARIELSVDSLESELGDPNKTLPTTRDYLAVCQNLSELGEQAVRFVARMHADPLKTRARSTPAERVFHFLRLNDLQDERVVLHATAYSRACNQWLSTTLTQGDVTGALKILALVVTAAPTHAPESPQKLFEITYATLERILPVSEVTSLEESLAKIQSAISRMPNSAGWKRAAIKATARLKLARAQAMETSPEAVLLAAEALELEAQLAVNVSAFLVVTAPRLALPHASAHDYVRAITVFKETLALTPVIPQQQAQVDSFRARLVDRGTGNAVSEVTHRRFAKAKAIIEQVARIAVTPLEKRQVGEALRDYYAGYTNALLRRDSEEALALSREALQVFPADPTIRRQADSAVYVRLERKIGELGTTRTRLGAAGVLRLLGATVKQMITEEGASTCQELLGRVEKTWKQQLDERKGPGEGFDIALQIAYLNQHDKQQARVRAAKVLWKDFDKSLVRRDWRRVEACVDTYFDRCPDLRRPTQFKTGYLQYLRQLNTTGEKQKLRRHRALFAAAYPNTPVDLGSTPPSIVGREANHHATQGADSAAPTPGPGQSWEPAGLWKEPATDSPVAAATGQGPGVPGNFLLVTSLLALATLAIATWKQGFLAFHWYALGAFIMGTTAGFFWERPLEAEDDTRSGSVAATQAPARATSPPASAAPRTLRRDST
jgi:tetratricopeptide (TPR) repeat protein